MPLFPGKPPKAVQTLYLWARSQPAPYKQKAKMCFFSLFFPLYPGGGGFGGCSMMWCCGGMDENPQGRVSPGLAPSRTGELKPRRHTAKHDPHPTSRLHHPGWAPVFTRAVVSRAAPSREDRPCPTTFTRPAQPQTMASPRGVPPGGPMPPLAGPEGL